MRTHKIAISCHPWVSFFAHRVEYVFRLVTYLVEVDGGLPELLLGLVEVTHTNLTEVTGVVLVNVGAVVVLTTLDVLLVTLYDPIGHAKTYGHTTTTGMLPVLSNTSVTSGDV